MSELSIDSGHACLVGALVAFAYGAVAGIYGGHTGDRRWVDSARRAVYAAAGLLVICVVVLEAAFLRSDFSVALVADHSSTTTPTLYKMTALWGSQGGSLMLWAFVLSLASSGVLFATRHKHREVVPWATAVLCGLGVFFTGLMIVSGGDAMPFTRMSPVPAEGVGLNPLLRHPAMAIHPPMLYSGYVLFSIPFAFAIGALKARRLDTSWIRSTRRFALLAWIFLSVGILLGAGWSYVELGWGGYWGWDPVENASLMPWLVGTAFLHSIMVQERRGMLKVWNVSLICATFALSLLGTFLVRSGILQSIHAFGASTVGTPLLVLIALVLAGSTALIVSRLPDLRSERRIQSLASREAVFLVNNILLIGLAFVVFYGTFFPLIAEAFTGNRSTLAAPWFDQYVTPLAILLVLFTGIGPLLAWRQISAGRALRLFGPPLAVAAVVLVALLAFTDVADEPGALIMFTFAAFALAGLVSEFVRGASAQNALTGDGFLLSLGRVVVRNRRRYGGYIVHIGIVIAFVSIAASSSFQTSDDVRMLPGDSTTVDDYELTYVRPTAYRDLDEDRLTFGSVVEIRRDGEVVDTLTPSRNYYSSSSTGTVRSFFEGEATSEVGRSGGAGEDFWTAMRPDLTEPKIDNFISGADRQIDEITIPEVLPDPSTPGGVEEMRGIAEQRSQLQGLAITNLQERFEDGEIPIDFRINVNPLVIWIWVGGAIGVIGGLIAAWPTASARRRRVSDVYAARLAKDLGRAS
ncbi:MAG: cytochrome c-type biosis protein CcmF [Solirubrobacterales bacterium]|jgi:cytochrome c-type biogenesis protein CcmF|nr:cytochrome c-type biosis protein CcmF [Solirubrobacterales bacterium]